MIEDSAAAVSAIPASALPELYTPAGAGMALPRMPKNTPVAMAYVPMQETPEMYSPAMGYGIGTLFPELNKPFTGRKGVLE